MRVQGPPQVDEVLIVRVEVGQPIGVHEVELPPVRATTELGERPVDVTQERGVVSAGNP